MAALDTYDQFKKISTNRHMIDYMNKLNRSISCILTKTMHSQQIERQNKILIKTYSETLAKSKDNCKNFNDNSRVNNSVLNLVDSNDEFYSERVLSANPPAVSTLISTSENQFTNGNGSSTTSSYGKRDQYSDLYAHKLLNTNNVNKVNSDHSFDYKADENVYDQWTEHSGNSKCSCENKFRATNNLINDILNCYDTLSNQMNDYFQDNYKLKLYCNQLDAKINYLFAWMNNIENTNN